MPRISISAFAFLSLSPVLFAQQQSPLPELPTDIPKDAVVRMVLMDKTPSGQDAVWKSSDGTIHEFFQFNDRGRGSKIYTSYRLDSRGLIVFEESNGVDYMKTPVAERFSMNAGEAVWKNQAENEKQSKASGKFFVDLNGGPEAGAILSRALRRPKARESSPCFLTAKRPFANSSPFLSKAPEERGPPHFTRSAGSASRLNISGSMKNNNCLRQLAIGSL